MHTQTHTHTHTHTPLSPTTVPQIVKNWYLFVCVASGLWGGLAIGLQTEYFTSNRYKPVQVGARPPGARY